MKRLILCLLLSISTIVYAQDIIVTNDAESIKGYNVDCSSKYAYYQLSVEASAPIHRIALSEVIAIRFADGSKYVPSDNSRKAARNLVSGAYENNGTYIPRERKSTAQGTYDLGGRGISGSLPQASFVGTASGKVVVKITVNAQGQVVAAEITTGTNTSNQALRQAAVDAAKNAKFAAASGSGNVTGTITYFFDSND